MGLQAVGRGGGAWGGGDPLFLSPRELPSRPDAVADRRAAAAHRPSASASCICIMGDKESIMTAHLLHLSGFSFR